LDDTRGKRQEQHQQDVFIAIIFRDDLK